MGRLCSETGRIAYFGSSVGVDCGAAVSVGRHAPITCRSAADVMLVDGNILPIPPESILRMLAFGAGTLPSMLSSSILFGKLGVSTLRQGPRYFLVIVKLVG